MASNDQSAAKLAAALDNARLGFKILPLHALVQGQCTCNAPNCPSPGKHPIGNLVPNGLYDATDDANVIDQLWAKSPNANNGLRMGAHLQAFQRPLAGKGWCAWRDHPR